MGDDIFMPCGQIGQAVHLIIAFFAGLNMCLTTWLSVRAKRRDRHERRMRDDSES